MSNRRGRNSIEQSISSSPAVSEVRADMLRNEAVTHRPGRVETPERERINAAAERLFRDPSITIEEHFSALSREQAETQATLSHFLKAASAAADQGDEKAFLQAVSQSHKARNELSTSRKTLYQSEAKKTAETRNPELFEALKKANKLQAEIKQDLDKIDARVKQDMDASKFSTQLIEAKDREENAWKQLRHATDTSQETGKAQSHFDDASNELDDTQAAYDAAFKASVAHHKAESNFAQTQKDYIQAEKNFNAIESECYEKLTSANFRENIRKSLSKLEPAEQEQFKLKFGHDSEHFASALLLKYPMDWDLREAVKMIRLDSSHLLISGHGQLDQSDAEYKEKSLQVDVAVMTTKREALEKISSRKWREMQEELLSLRAQSKNKGESEEEE